MPLAEVKKIYFSMLDIDNIANISHLHINIISPNLYTNGSGGIIICMSIRRADDIP